nr:hypothetical protein [Thalassobacillus sp. C254]
MEAGSVERRGIESLIKAGAFDELGKDRAVLLASLDAAIEFAEFQRDIGSLFEQGEADFRYIDQEPLQTLKNMKGKKK